MKNSKNWRVLIAIVYVCLIVFLLFLAPFRQNTNTEIQLIPFESLWELFRPFFYSPHNSSAEYKLYILFILTGNFFVFYPLPFLFQWKPKKWAAMIIALSIPIAVEFTQNLFQVGSATTDDVILNASGLYLGFWTYRKKN